jgi:aminoglycoside phosphotransferase (APT) family kinase protein
VFDADMAIELGTLVGRVHRSQPRWSSTTAMVNGDHVVKFAWSRIAAQALWREAVVLQGLAAVGLELRLPEVTLVNRDPVLVVTRRMAGDPLTFEFVGRSDGAAVPRLGAEIASYLAVLHRPEVLGRMQETSAMLVTPEPQATTDELRARFGKWTRPDQRPLVAQWCDWVDATLQPDDSAPTVFLHGDLHGHNELWDLRRCELRGVVDFQSAGPGERAFDFRYLPAQGPTVDLLLATVNRYVHLTGVPVSLDRIMGWHIRTVLGDALWRSEASVALPGGGTPPEWVDELQERMTRLGFVDAGE